MPVCPAVFHFPPVRRSKKLNLKPICSFYLSVKNRSEAACAPKKCNLKSIIKAEVYGLIGNLYENLQYYYYTEY